MHKIKSKEDWIELYHKAKTSNKDLLIFPEGWVGPMLFRFSPSNCGRVENGLSVQVPYKNFDGEYILAGGPMSKEDAVKLLSWLQNWLANN